MPVRSRSRRSRSSRNSPQCASIARSSSSAASKPVGDDAAVAQLRAGSGAIARASSACHAGRAPGRRPCCQQRGRRREARGERRSVAEDAAASGRGGRGVAAASRGCVWRDRVERRDAPARGERVAQPGESRGRAVSSAMRDAMRSTSAVRSSACDERAPRGTLEQRFDGVVARPRRRAAQRLGQPLAQPPAACGGHAGIEQRQQRRRGLAASVAVISRLRRVAGSSARNSPRCSTRISRTCDSAACWVALA